jgi:hypothetical protein
MERNARRKALAQKRAPGLEPLSEEDRQLASMFDGGPAAAHLRLETPTEYAQRRARENDRTALELQVNGFVGRQ